jgi:alpha-tubulin suppressor-like RCC1 family protein
MENNQGNQVNENPSAAPPNQNFKNVLIITGVGIFFVLMGFALAYLNKTYNWSTSISDQNNQRQEYNYYSNTEQDSNYEVKKTIDTNMKLSQVTTGDNFSCGIGTDGNAYCKGNNKYGQLGDGTEISSTEIVAVYTEGVLYGKTIKQIMAGRSYACAIASDDKAYCWGANGSGNLGNKSNWGSPYPVAVYTGGVLKGKTIKSISVGVGHTCAIASDDQAYCWGFNSYNGRLGNNSDKESNMPVAVDTTGVLSGKTIKTISVGSGNTCAIASDDQAYCWGDGYYGLLGNNTKTFSWVPVAVYTGGALNGKTIKSIDTFPLGELNTDHVCAIASDNNKYCWGHDENGLSTLGQYKYNAVPTLSL